MEVVGEVDWLNSRVFPEHCDTEANDTVRQTRKGKTGHMSRRGRQEARGRIQMILGLA